MFLKKLWNRMNRRNREMLSEIQKRIFGVEEKLADQTLAIENFQNAIFCESAKRELESICQSVRAIERKFDEAANQKKFVRSYAQHGEDVVILQCFKMMGIDFPSYIDIGAHHPYIISNTALMYENGCRGINVEANPNLIEFFKKERPQDKNVCCAIGREEGEMPFYMTDDYSQVSSISKEHVEKWLSYNPQAKIQKVVNVKVDTVKNVIEKFWGGGGYALII